MNQYRQVTSIVIKAAEEHLLTAALINPKLTHTMNTLNMVSYPWNVKDPIINLLSLGVFPPGGRIIQQNGDRIYYSAVGLWYEDASNIQTEILNLIASTGAFIYFEQTLRPNLHRVGLSKTGEGNLTIKEYPTTLIEPLEEHLLRLGVPQNIITLENPTLLEAKYINKVLSLT